MISLNEIVINCVVNTKITVLFIYRFFEDYAEYCVEHRII